MSGVGEYFSSIFGKSPFKPIQEHMNLCARAAAGVVPLIEAVNAVWPVPLSTGVPKTLYTTPGSVPGA